MVSALTVSLCVESWQMQITHFLSYWFPYFIFLTSVWAIEVVVNSLRNISAKKTEALFTHNEFNVSCNNLATGAFVQWCELAPFLHSVLYLPVYIVFQTLNSACYFLPTNWYNLTRMQSCILETYTVCIAGLNKSKCNAIQIVSITICSYNFN